MNLVHMVFITPFRVMMLCLTEYNYLNYCGFIVDIPVANASTGSSPPPVPTGTPTTSEQVDLWTTAY